MVMQGKTEFFGVELALWLLDCYGCGWLFTVSLFIGDSHELVLALATYFWSVLFQVVPTIGLPSCWPFWHHQKILLSQTCSNTAVLFGWKGQEGVFRGWPCCDRMYVGDTGNKIFSQPLHAFKLDQAWGLRPRSIMEIIWSGAAQGCRWEAMGQMLVYICLSWAHSTAQRQIFPTPKFMQEMQPKSTHVKALQCLSLGLCVEIGVRYSMFIFFCRISFPSPHHF